MRFVCATPPSIITLFMSTASPSQSPQSSATGRGFSLVGALLGIAVFLAGVAMVYYVFTTARVLFDAPPPALPAPTPTPSPSPGAGGANAGAGQATAVATSAALVLGQSFTHFLQRLFVLLVMCIAGSAMASLGVRLFFNSLAARGE